MELIKSGILYNYDFGLESEYSFYNALNDSNSIVLMGSSELTQSDTNRAMPFNFIPKNSHFNLLAIGIGGNQCFSIYTQLYSARKYLNNSKIVIIISPNWFINRYSVGTSLASFFKFNNNRFLHRIINNSSQNDLFKNYIGEYIVKNYSNIESNNTLINYYYYKHLSMKNNFYGVAFFPIVKMLSFINNLPIIILAMIIIIQNLNIIHLSKRLQLNSILKKILYGMNILKMLLNIRNPFQRIMILELEMIIII